MRHSDLPHQIITSPTNHEFTHSCGRGIGIDQVQIFSRVCAVRCIFLLILLFWTAVNCFCQHSSTTKEIFEILSRKDHTSLVRKVDEMKRKDLHFLEWEEEDATHLIHYAEHQGDEQGIVLSILLGNNFRALSYREDFNKEEVDRAMLMARLSNNKLLLANAYWVNGWIQSNMEQFESMLVYYNAAYELFRELGVPESEYLNNIDFDISVGSYLRYNYRGCVDHCLRYYQRMNEEHSIITELQKIHVLDLMGAGYRQLGMPDSSTFYYNQLLEILAYHPDDFNETENALWTSIAGGRIGENYLDLGEIPLAIPRITKYYTESRRLGDSLNILLSGNALAHLRYNTGELQEALRLWKEILLPSNKRRMEHLSEKICRGIARVYQAQQNMDSMVYYMGQATYLRSRVDQIKYESSQKVVQQEYEFLRLSTSVQHLNTRVKSMKNTRNLSILIILLISGTIYLLQRKRTYKLKYISEVEKARSEQVQQKLNASMDQLMTLKDNLNERNNLARVLIERIRKLEQSKDASQLISEINDYILNSPEGWEKFKSTFLDIHPHFLHNLNEKSPGLSPAEIRLSLLLYLNLDNSEIANMLGISSASVSRSKSRLKQKLNLDHHESLNEFITSL